MCEPPDFDAIAARFVSPVYVRKLTEQLRLIWNARGAVDIATIETAYHPEFGNGAPSMKTLDAAIRQKDR